MSVYECPQKLGRKDVCVYVTIHPSTDLDNRKIQCIKELRSLTKLEQEDDEEVYDCLSLLNAKLSCDYLFEDRLNNKVLIHMDRRSFHLLKLSEYLVFTSIPIGIFTDDDDILI